MDKLINCEDEDHDYLFKIVVIGLIFLKKSTFPPLKKLKAKLGLEKLNS